MSEAPTDATDWAAVALSKLCKILGEQEGRKVLTNTLAAAGLAELRSADDLKRFAEFLKPQGGLLGPTGALLSLHAVIHATRSALGG